MKCLHLVSKKISNCCKYVRIHLESHDSSISCVPSKRKKSQKFNTPCSIDVALLFVSALPCPPIFFGDHHGNCDATKEKEGRHRSTRRRDFVWLSLWTASPANIADGRLKREWKRIPSLYMHRWKVNAPCGSFRGPFDSDLGSTVFVRGWITPCAARFNRRCSRYAD